MKKYKVYRTYLSAKGNTTIVACTEAAMFQGYETIGSVSYGCIFLKGDVRDSFPDGMDLGELRVIETLDGGCPVLGE
jgi:hypothetical protein